MTVQVKICGLNAPDAVAAAAGADFAGFVFFARSPRNVTAEQAAALASKLPRRVKRVAVMVDPDDAALRAMLVYFRPDFVQLHGAEPPARVAAIRRAFSLGVIKALAVRAAADLDAARAYEEVADWLMFDAKPPALPDAMPGGNAARFDWTLPAGRTFARPWFLSGGLDAASLAAAVAQSGAGAVDVSSGVEDRPGHKDPARVRAFLAAARELGLAAARGLGGAEPGPPGAVARPR